MKNIFLFLVTFLVAKGSLAIEESFAVGTDLDFSTACDARNDLATVSFVGDVLIHKPLYQAVVAGTQHFSQIWKRTEGLIQKADFSVGNLEGPAALGIDGNGKDHGDIGFVYDGSVYSGTNMIFNYHPRILADLKNSGYDLLTNANNHSLDRKSIGIDKTIYAARQVGIPLVGVRASQERNAVFYKIVSVKNVNIAFLGCTEMTNGNPDTKEQLLFCYKNPDVILNIIRDLSARSDVDAVIVMPHWGVEYNHTPEAQQKLFAKKYLDAGASAVVGSHPHVLQPWQKYVTQDGRETLVIYSLGNFVALQGGLSRKTGAVAYIGFSKEGSHKAHIFGAGYTPTYRDGLEVYPVGGNGFKDVLNLTAQMYGNKGRIEPGGNLLSVLCTR